MVGMLVAAARPPSRFMAALGRGSTADDELRAAFALAELGRPGPAADGELRAALRRVGGVLTRLADEADDLASAARPPCRVTRLAQRLRALAGEVTLKRNLIEPSSGRATLPARGCLREANDGSSRIFVMDFENTISSPPTPPTPLTTPTCQSCGCQTIDADAEPRPRCHRCRTDWNGLFTERKDGQGYEDGVPRKEGRCTACGGTVYSHRGEMPLSCSGCASDF